MTTIGTYYYPEQWPREQWARDFDRIASMGLKIVHMAEFAWFNLEPSPGEFTFDWLDECMQHCVSRDLQVILCTPTAAPPIWLSQNHADVLPVTRSQQNARHGGRRHYNPLSPSLHEATRRIVTQMVDRYGDHPCVIGWQIDNEYSLDFDQTDLTHNAFREWLKGKYETIDRLNHAWGNQFWAQHYTDFSQIFMPHDRVEGYDNPHHKLDASRFWSRAFAQYNKLQADLLKPKIGTRFITTNFMPFHLDCNPADMADDLSLFAWDTYPATGWGGPYENENYRMADPTTMEFQHEHMRSFNHRWGLLEVQPGQVNWTGKPILLFPGAVRLWLWTAIAHDAEFITTYRFRQPRFGAEMWHHGLIAHDGVTATPGGRQFEQVAKEVKDLGDLGPRSIDNTVGLLFDFDNLWWIKTQQQHRNWEAGRHVSMHFDAVAKLGLDTEILHPDRPWPQGLKLILVPGMPMMAAETIAKLKAFAEAGGHVLFTCRTAIQDKNGQFWEGPTAQPLVELIGATIEAYDVLPDGNIGKVEMDEPHGMHAWHRWADLLYVDPDAKAIVLGRYADQFYDDATAIVRNAVGQGTVTYNGVYDEGSLTDTIVQMLAREAGYRLTPMPPRVRAIRRGEHTIILNYTDKPFDVVCDDGCDFRLGTRKVGPAGVAVLRGRLSMGDAEQESKKSKRR